MKKDLICNLFCEFIIPVYSEDSGKWILVFEDNSFLFISQTNSNSDQQFNRIIIQSVNSVHVEIDHTYIEDSQTLKSLLTDRLEWSDKFQLNSVNEFPQIEVMKSLELAKGSYLFFFDEEIPFAVLNEAHRILMNHDYYVDALLECAKLWKSLFDNSELALDCLIKAESLANNTDDWLNIVRLYVTFENNETKIAEALVNAETVANTNYDWLEIAKAYYNLFYSKQKINEALIEAKKLTFTLNGQLKIANLRYSLINDTQGILEIIDEQKNESDLDKTKLIVDLYLKIGDEEEAKKYIDSKLNQSKSGLDSYQLINVWIKKFHDKDRVYDFLRDTLDKSFCIGIAEQWINEFENKEEALRYIIYKLPLVDKGNNYYNICKFLIERLDNKELAKNYLNGVVTDIFMTSLLNKKGGDFVFRIHLSRYLGIFNHNEVKLKVLKIKNQIINIYGEFFFAELLSQLFHDQSEIEKFIWKKIKTRSSIKDWYNIFDLMEKFSLVSKFQEEAIKRLEFSAVTTADWFECYKIRKRYFPSKKKEFEYIKKAELKAKSKNDFLLLGQFWGKFFPAKAQKYYDFEAKLKY